MAPGPRPERTYRPRHRHRAVEPDTRRVPADRSGIVTASTFDRGRWVWFIAWMVTGIAYSFGLLGALTIGPLVVVIAVVATLFLGNRPAAHVGVPGLVSGLSVPLFYVAYLNRAGPGTICRNIGTTHTCTDEWSPWPWLVIGAALFVGGSLWFRSKRV